MSVYQIDPANPLPSQFLAFREQLQSLCNRTSNSIAAFGAAGIGKSYTARKMLTEMGYVEYNREIPIRPNQKIFEIYRVPPSATQFAQHIWEMREANCILVLDDGGDSFMQSTDSDKINLAKNVLANGKRIISMDNATVRREHDKNPGSAMPTSFTVGTLGICWISNLHPDNVEDMQPKVREHVRAIMSRMDKVVFSNDASHIIDYTLDLAYNSNMLHDINSGGKIIQPKLAEVNDALEWYVANAASIRSPGCRALESIVRFRHLYPNNWQTSAANELGEKRKNIFVKPFVPKPITRTFNPLGKRSDDKRKAYWAKKYGAKAAQEAARKREEQARAEAEAARKRAEQARAAFEAASASFNPDPRIKKWIDRHAVLLALLTNSGSFEGERNNARVMLQRHREQIVELGFGSHFLVRKILSQPIPC